jgi:hypothetical protein
MIRSGILFLHVLGSEELENPGQVVRIKWRVCTKSKMPIPTMAPVKIQCSPEIQRLRSAELRWLAEIFRKTYQKNKGCFYCLNRLSLLLSTSEFSSFSLVTRSHIGSGSHFSTRHIVSHSTVSSGIVIFCIYPSLKRHWNLFLKFDAVGLGVFTVSGATIAYNLFGLNFLVMALAGTLSAVGGGILRDVFVNEVPIVFVKELYASASFVGIVRFLYC